MWLGAGLRPFLRGRYRLNSGTRRCTHPRPQTQPYSHPQGAGIEYYARPLNIAD